jgi:hypothetical protein
MPVTGFYNDNANRSYPFITDLGSPTWLAAAIVDFGCVVGTGTDYDENTDSVYLYKVSRTGSTFTFEFRCTEAVLFYYSLLFTRDLSDGEYATEYADAIIPALSSESAGYWTECADGPSLWDGFLITGDLTELAAAIADAGSWTVPTAAETQIEPTLVKNMGKMYARSVNLANAARTRVTATESCSSLAELDDYDYYVGSTCIQGNLIVKEGYNCRIRQSTLENSLTFDVTKGAGDGEPCEEIPIYTSEPVPVGSTVFSGGPVCNELITSINSVSGTMSSPQLLKLTGGTGVTIRPTPGTPHSLDISFNLSDFTVCIGLSDSSSAGGS